MSDVEATAEATLRSLGFRVRSRSELAWELLLPNSRPATRTLRGDRGRITLSEARKRGDQISGSRTLLVASGASHGVLDAARLGRWDLLTWEPPRAVINGITYEAVGTEVPPDAPRRRDRHDALAATGTRRGGRLPWVRWGVARVLLVAGPQSVGALSERLGVSPQAVRRALNQLGGLVSRDAHGEWSPNVAAELEASWRSAYPGPLGNVTTWWHPLPPDGQARAVAVMASRAGAQPLLASDARGVVTAYVRENVDLRPVGFTPAAAEHATLRLVEPRDPTLWATAAPGTVAGEPVLSADRLLAGLAAT